MEIAKALNAAIIPLATVGEELSFDETDCSNPQQGTGSGLGRPCMAQSPPTTAVGVVAGRLPSPLTTDESVDSAVTKKRSAKHDSRCHHLQESRSAPKIPPTLKNNRKLFVGGLPMDGTSGRRCSASATL
jgi:hypothetical protein